MTTTKEEGSKVGEDFCNEGPLSVLEGMETSKCVTAGSVTSCLGAGKQVSSEFYRTLSLSNTAWWGGGGCLKMSWLALEELCIST